MRRTTGRREARMVPSSRKFPSPPTTPRPPIIPEGPDKVIISLNALNMLPPNGPCLDRLWYLLDVVDPVAKFRIMDNNDGGGEDFVPEGKNLNQVIDYPRDDAKAVHVPGYRYVHTFPHF